MKHYLQIHLLLFLVVILNQASAQGVSNFYPLQVGNYWEYENRAWGGAVEDTTSYSVVRDTLISGKTYFLVAIRSFKFGTSYAFERLDTAGNVMKFTLGDTAETLVYRFADTAKTFWPQDQFLARFDSLAFSEVFSTSRPVLYVGHYQPYDSSFVPYIQELAEGIGPLRTYTTEGQGEFLRGARIADSTYGTITSVKTDSRAIPISVSLEQNFPNPFNPETRMSFSIPQTEWVTLTIYNPLGQRVAVLVNSKLPPGPHTIEWSPVNLSSGAYLYVLQCGFTVFSRKLVYVK